MTAEFAIRSRDSGIEIPIVRYGSDGAPVVYVPTSGGDHREFEAYGLAEEIRAWIVDRRLQVFSIDGHGPRTLFSDDLPPAQRMAAYARFERALVTELIPEVARRTGRERFGWVGASYGAFVVANVLLKHPERVDAACGMGGVYGLWHRLDGHCDETVRSHTPLDYLPGLSDDDALTAVRRTRGVCLFGGGRDEWADSTTRFERELRAKGLPHEARWWHDADHHERWWRKQFREFLHDYYGPDGPRRP